MSQPSYYKIIWKQFSISKLNKLGLFLVCVMFGLAILAPFLASDKPFVFKKDGSYYFPLFRDITSSVLGLVGVTYPAQYANHPEFQEEKFRLMKLSENDFRLMPLIPYSPTEYNLEEVLLPPSSKHFLGTDEQGRDVASRMVHGSKVSLSVGFVAVALYVVIGVILGTFSGFYGGWVDVLISRLVEVMMCFPTFFLMLAVLGTVKNPGLFWIMVVIGITGWPDITRLVRGEFLKLRGQDFIMAVRSIGAKPGRIMFRHLLPNGLAPVMISTSFGIASAVLVESSLSFLGFGVQPPTPSWGAILKQGREFMDIAWWLTVFPGIAIFLTITAFNLVGEGLRDAIDPKLKKA